MLAAFWYLLWLVARSFVDARAPARGFVLAGCAALVVGTLQGPIQAFPAVHDLLDEGGDAGAVIVNLHAQLNMLGGLLVMLVGVTLALLARLGGARLLRAESLALAGVALGVATYYAVGIEMSVAEAYDVGAERLSTRQSRGSSPGLRCYSSRPHSRCWSASQPSRSAPGG